MCFVFFFFGSVLFFGSMTDIMIRFQWIHLNAKIPDMAPGKTEEEKVVLVHVDKAKSSPRCVCPFVLHVFLRLVRQTW